MITLFAILMLVCVVSLSASVIISFRNSGKVNKVSKINSTLAERVNILCTHDQERKTEVRELKDQHRYDIEQMMKKHDDHIMKMLQKHTEDISNLNYRIDELSKDVKILQNMVGANKHIMREANVIPNVIPLWK